MSGNRALVVGDLHCKQAELFAALDGAIAENEVSRIVFLGDYVDDWRTTADDVLRALEAQRGWLASREDSGLQVDLLIGNHDFAYLMRSPCSGTHTEAMEPIRDSLLGLPMLAATTVDGFLVTHAGVAQKWLDRWVPSARSAEEAASTLNSMLGDDPDLMRALGSAGPSRGGRGIPGPLWADASDLRHDAAKGFDQIAGHTPVGTCMSLATLGGNVWLCDTFSTMSNGVPIGDGTALLVKDGEVEKIRLLR